MRMGGLCGRRSVASQGRIFIAGSRMGVLGIVGALGEDSMGLSTTDSRQRTVDSGQPTGESRVAFSDGSFAHAPAF